MTIDRRAARAAGRGALDALLAKALAEGHANDFDAPAEAAVAHSRLLLATLADAFDGVAALDVVVAVDGAIEITAALGELMLTIDVSPSGQRTEAVLDRPASGEVAWASRNAQADEILREIERAA